MYENIGVRLALVADFSNAARNAQENLGKITASFEALQERVGKFNVSGIDALNVGIMSLGVAAGATTATLERLSAGITSLNSRSAGAATRIKDLDASLGGVAARAAATGAGFQTAAAGMDRVEKTTRGAAASADNAATAMVRLATSATGLGTIRVDGLGRSFMGVEESVIQTIAAVNALDAALIRLNAQRAIGSEMRMALPGGGSYRQRAEEAARLSSSGPIMAMGGRGQYALPGEERLALPGGTDPNYNNRAWYANQRQNEYNNGSGGGPPIVVPPGGYGSGWQESNGPTWGERGGEAFKRSSRFGDNMQSAGMSGLMNAAMISSIAVPMVKSAMDLDDLVRLTNESLSADKVSAANQKVFTENVMKLAAKDGGNLRAEVAGTYQFASSLPREANVNFNDPKQMQAMTETYEKLIKLQIIGSSSAHPIAQGELNLDVAATSRNLGLPMHNAKEVQKAYAYAANVLAIAKNETSTEVDLMTATIKAIGPIAASQGMNPDQVVGLADLLAENKVRGAQAGNFIKRLASRQAMNPKQVSDVKKAVDEESHGRMSVSMYTKDHQVKNLFDWVGDIGDVEKHGGLNGAPMSPEGRARLEGKLGGLYAGTGLSAFMNSYRSMGGREGLKKFGEEMLPNAHRVKGKDAVDGLYGTRTDGNPLTASQKLDNTFTLAMQHTFRLMEPDLIKIMGYIGNLIQAWDKLNPTVQKTVVVVGATSVAFSLVSGVIGFLLGNFIKLASGIGTVVTTGMRFGEFLLGIKNVAGEGSAVLSRFAGFFEGILPRVFGTAIGAMGRIFPILARFAPAFLEVIGVGARIASLANPIGIVIGAATLLWEAWSHDWGNIRENTNQTTKDIQTNLQRLWSWVSGTATHLWDGVKNATSSFGGWLKNWVTNLPAIFTAAGAEMMNAGGKYISMFADGVKNGVGAAVDKIKGAYQAIKALRPSSEPKDSSSPLAGQTASGNAYAGMFIEGAILGIANGAKKLKKGLKPVSDTMIVLKGESIAQVEQMAAGIEATLDRAGARIHKKWIDLFDPKTHTAARVYGDPKAFSLANKGGGSDKSVSDAHDFLLHMMDQMKMDPSSLTPEKVKALVDALRRFELKSTTGHAVAEIEHMASTIELAGKKATDKIAKAIGGLQSAFYGKTGDGGTVGAVDKMFANEDKQGTRFSTTTSRYDERLQNMVKMRKDDNAPTTRELNNELTLEINERNALMTILKEEVTQRDAINQKIEDLQKSEDKIIGTDAASVALKQQINASIAAEKDKLDGLNVTLGTQQTQVLAVDKSIQQYKLHIDQVKSSVGEFGTIVKESMDKASKAMADTLGKDLGSLADNWVDRILGGNGKTKSPLMDAFNSYVKTFVKTMVSNVFDNMMKTMGDTIGSILNGGGSKDVNGSTLSGGGGGGGIMGTLGAMFGVKTGGASGKKTPDGTPSDPVTVTMQSATGSTDVGQGTMDGVNTLTSLFGGKASSSSSAASGIGSYAGAEGDPGAASGGGGGGSSQAAADTQHSAGSVLGGGMEGLAVGTAIAPGNPWAAGLGAVGGAVGEYYGGPVGAMIGSAVGGFVGSLLGPHWGPASNTPDRAGNVQQYGQTLANWQGGHPTVNGTKYNADAAFDPAQGGSAEWQQVEALANNTAITGSLTTAQQATVNYFKGLEAGNPNANLGIASEHNGVYTLGDGQKANVADFQTNLTAMQAIMANANAGALQAQQNANRYAASFTTMMINAPSGFVMPGFLGGGGTGPATNGDITRRLPVGTPIGRPPGVGGVFGSVGTGSGSGTGGTGGGTGGGSVGGATVVVQILQGATVSGDAQAIADEIRKAIPDITNAVNQGQYQAMRRVGNYQSVTT